MPGRITDEQRQKILDAVGMGAHPQVACTAAGLGRKYFYDLRYRARRGDTEAAELLAAIEQAEGGSEINAVAASHRATQPIEEAKINCPHCGETYVAEAEHLAALAMRVFDAQKAKSLAADVALKTLERRHPKRWSQKVVHTIAEEHDGLLDVAERVLAPEAFQLLLEAYLASRESTGEAGGAEGGPTSEREVH